MSIEQARAFLDRLEHDPEFRARLEGAADFDERNAIVVAEGYGEVRLNHVRDALSVSEGGELSDEELAGVAGGRVGWQSGVATGATTGTALAVFTAACFIL